MANLDLALQRLSSRLAGGGDGLRILIHASDTSLAAPIVERAAPKARLVLYERYEGFAECLADTRPDICLSYRFGADYPRAPLVAGPHSPVYVHVAGTGFDHLRPFDRANILVCNSAGFQAPVMADYALAAIYAINLDFAHFFAQQTQRHWQGRSLRSGQGQRAVVLGTGPIGTAIAARLTAAGLDVTGVSRSGRPNAAFAQVRPVVELSDVVQEADHLVISIPRTDETEGLVSARVLAGLPDGAGVVNLARGGIVDEAALLAELRAGRLRGAVFDVFATEPLPPEDPLWDAPGMIVTPHSSALFDGWEVAAAEVFADNLGRIARGQAPRNRVDPDRGY